MDGGCYGGGGGGDESCGGGGGGVVRMSVLVEVWCGGVYVGSCGHSLIITHMTINTNSFPKRQ